MKIGRTIIKIIGMAMEITIVGIVIIMVLYMATNEMNKKNYTKYNEFVVVSESMYPVLKKGDIVVSKKCLKSEINNNDIIIFYNGEELIIHRIVEIDNDYYITKGDNNKTFDKEKVHFNDINGKLKLRIPFIGNIIMLVSGHYKTFVFILFILMIIYHKERKLYKKRIERRKKKKIEDEKNNQIK